MLKGDAYLGSPEFKFYFLLICWKQIKKPHVNYYFIIREFILNLTSSTITKKIMYIKYRALLQLKYLNKT